jgi:hypothetical protein
MSAKYALHPGQVTSKRDGQIHHIDAHMLVRLYGVRHSECLVVKKEFRHKRERELYMERIERMGLIHLYPRHDGNYALPGAGRAL